MNPVNEAHKEIAAVLHKGDFAIDATIGNGHDTLFLARMVATGTVFGFDIQSKAIENTRIRLQQEKLGTRVTLILSGHETLANHLPQQAKGQIKAVIFNLGYLPGADHATITKPETTIPAISQSIKHLHPEGIIAIVYYLGHQGGKEEANAIRTFLQNEKDIQFQERKNPIKTNAPPPGLFLLRKIG